MEDPKTAAALAAEKEYQKRLRNPDSMQLRMAYVTDAGAVCLEIVGQNGMGGNAVSKVALLPNGEWHDGTGFHFGADIRNRTGRVDDWVGLCVKSFHRKLVPGTDVIEKVNQALKER